MTMEPRTLPQQIAIRHLRRQVDRLARNAQIDLARRGAVQALLEGRLPATSPAHAETLTQLRGLLLILGHALQGEIPRPPMP